MKRDPVTAYAKAKKVVGRPVRLACERHLNDLKQQKQLGLVWKPERAQQAIDFFATILVLEDGRPFMLEPFQQFIVGSVFGWYGADGYRRFRTAYVEIGKGNGKTPMAAGIGLYGLIADNEGSAEVYSAATSSDQAAICFKDAVGFVERNPELGELITKQVGSLAVLSTRSVFRALSSEHKSLDGKRVHIGLIDELHEHPSGLVVDKIRAGTKARRNALIFEITNSGYDRTSVCWAHHKMSLDVLEGTVINEAWFAYISALDDNDSWQDETVWRKANPGLGTILPVKYLREQVEEAKGMPSKENIVRRLNFCEWTEQSERAISMELWDQNSEPFDEAELLGRPCFGGLKLSSEVQVLSGLSAFVLVFPPLANEGCRVLPYYWAPEEDIAERSRAGVSFDAWVKSEHLISTPDNSTDAGRIAKKITELAKQYKILGVAINNNYAGEAATALKDLFGEDGLAFIGQTFLTMNAPVDRMFALLKDGDLRHGGHPILRWNASNLAIKIDAKGSSMPDQEHSGYHTPGIVGIVALLHALERFLRAEPAQASVYNERAAKDEEVLKFV